MPALRSIGFGNIGGHRVCQLRALTRHRYAGTRHMFAQFNLQAMLAMPRCVSAVNVKSPVSLYGLSGATVERQLSNVSIS